MTDLITRLSKLNAPDREVDRDIHIATNKPLREGMRFGHIPTYTASVDAVIALAKRVFGKVGYSVAETEDDGEAPFAFIHVNGEAYLGEGAMPATALCIAVLRAKEASK